MLQKLRPPPRSCPFLDKDAAGMAAVVSCSCRRLAGRPIALRLVSPRRQSNGSGHALQWLAPRGSSRCLADDSGFEESIVLPASEPNVRGAIEAIKLGKVIAVPTDTIYGFACDARSAEAIRKIYEIKGRQATKPLAVCVADVPDIPRIALTEHLPPGLLDGLLPGPVTIILRRGESSVLEKSLNPGVDSVGIRIPDCEFIRGVARGSGGALALTSANLSGRPSSVRVEDFESLWRHCAFVYDGGELPSGRAGSTVVDLTAAGKFTVTRPGSARQATTDILRRFCLTEAEN